MRGVDKEYDSIDNQQSGLTNRAMDSHMPSKNNCDELIQFKVTQDLQAVARALLISILLSCA